MTYSQSRHFIPSQGKNDVKFTLFGPMRKQDIRVGYIDPDRGYVTGITICESNTHAKKNPGAQFIIKNRDKVRFMNINDVNNLTPDSAYDSSGVPNDPCPGITFDQPKAPPVVEFMGGGGVGAKGNPVVGNDGAVIAVHLVEGGFGYQYPPLVDVQDNAKIGAGVVAEAILGEVHRGYETYGEETDVEDYFPLRTADGANIKSLCQGGASEVPYGYTYNLDGKKLNEWDPTIYANLEENLFRRRILEYQEYLANLRTPWFATRYKGNIFPPSQISSDGGLIKNPEYIFALRKEYPPNKGRLYAVQHKAWGGYDVRNLDSDINASDGNKSTDKDLVNVTFDVFVHVAHSVRKGGGGLRFKFQEVLDRQAKPEQGRYGKHQFTIKCTDVTDVNTKDRGKKGDDLWDTEGIQSVTKKIKADTLYEVQSIGEYAGKKTEQGLIKNLGRNAEEVTLADEWDQKTGSAIFADLVASANDNDDIQIGARKGKFTAEGKWHTSDGITKNEPVSHFTHNKDGTWKETFKTKGHSTYDLYYTVTRKELEDEAGVTDDKFATEQEGAITQSFMNKYAVSPVPMSNDPGSDYANQLFTLEWDMLFPYPGEYTFVGQTDNECRFYLDGQLIGDLSTWNTAPWILKKTFNWPVDQKSGDTGKLYNVRLDMINTPVLEDAIVQQKEGTTFVAEDAAGLYEDVNFDGWANIKSSQIRGDDNVGGGGDAGDLVDVTFRSTSDAGCTNKFYVTPIDGVGDPKWVKCGYGNNGWNGFMRENAAFVERGGGTHTYVAYWTPPSGQNLMEIEYQTDGEGTIKLSGGVRPGKGFQEQFIKEVTFKSGGNWNNTIKKKIFSPNSEEIKIQLTVSNKNGVLDPNFGRDPGGIAVSIKYWNKEVWSTKEIFNTRSGGGTGEHGYNKYFASGGEVVLERNDQKTVTLKSGLDYGVYFTTTCETNPMGCEITNNGTKIAIEDLGVRTPTDDMVVTVSSGKFRSKDGTDDTGLFGHPNYGQAKDQILFSVPKKEVPPPDPLNFGGDNLQFYFKAQDASHSFAITAKDIQKSAQLTKSVKVNTVYDVKATVVNDSQNRVEQGPAKIPGGGDGDIDGDFHQAWESKQKIGSLHKLIHCSLIPTEPGGTSSLQILAAKGNFKLTRKYRHPYIPPLISDFTWREKKKGEGLQTYDITYEHIVNTPPIKPIRSTSTEIQTKNIFATDTHINDANRRLWRTNVYDRGGFLNKVGICPFPTRDEDRSAEELNDNPHAGDHKIIWNNINFPVSASYNIRVAVDDSVVLDFEGPNETIRIEKNGFINGQSTGDSLYTQWFDKGSYKLTATLTQKEGGRFGFKKLTEAEKKKRRERIFNDLFVPEPPAPATTEVTFNTTSRAGFTNSVTIAELGRLTRKGTMTRKVEIGKKYECVFTTERSYPGQPGYLDCWKRTKIRLNGNRRVELEDASDYNWIDLVLTVNGGHFENRRKNSYGNYQFCTYVAGPPDGASIAQPAPRFPQSIDDIKIKGLNPMSLAIDIKVSYGTVDRVSAKSWYENPMGVAFNIRAPLAPPPKEEEPKAEGRCPNNPLWTTRFTSNSNQTWYPCYSKVSDFDKTSLPEQDWGEFMNKYAMSPVPPKASKGSDEGGKWFENTWSVEIPYDGWYTFKMCSDNESEFYVDGVKIDKLTNPGWRQEKQKTIFIAKGAEPSEFRVRVKNKSTTKIRSINKKIFSARDWVKEGGASDEEFVSADRDLHQIRDVKFDLFSHVLTPKAGYGEIPAPVGDTVDVTFSSTDSADYTNRFFVVELGDPTNSNQVEWLNLHSRNYPLSNRVYDNGKKVCLLDHHGGDCNGNIHITSGNARFSQDGTQIEKIGTGSDTVTISYNWRDHARNHGDGFRINGVEWNNKASGYGDKGSMTKTVELSASGATEVLSLRRTQTKKVTLKSGTDYGCYFTSSGNKSNVTAEMTKNGTVISIDDLGKGGVPSSKYPSGKPRNNMIVTCSVGKYRSADGTDDTGVFGHKPVASNFRQILWSVSKADLGQGIRDNWNHNGLRFVFKEKGGNHEFVIRGDDVKDVGGAGKNIWHTGHGAFVTRGVKLNTEYEVVATATKNISGISAKTKCEQGLIKKLGRSPGEENTVTRGKYIFGDFIEDFSANDDDDIQIGATEGFFTTSNKKKIDVGKRKSGNTFDITYKIEWEPPVFKAKDLTRTGTTREGITYSGPYLFSYLEKDWGSVMNKYSVAVIEKETQDLSAPNDNILGTKILSWSNVPFEHVGNYEAIFIADDNAKFFINDEEVLVSKQGKFGDADAITRIFSIRTAGHYNIRIELENTTTHSPVFFENPTGVVLEITKPLEIATYDSDGIINSESWTKNPMGVSAECIPPPCAKLLDGKGVVDDVVIIDPGNKFDQPPKGDTPGDYNVINVIKGFKIIDPGINYSPDTVAKIDFGVGDPIETPVELGPFGKITKIVWPPPFEGEGQPTPPPPVTQWPTITFGPPTAPPRLSQVPPQPTGVNGSATSIITTTVLLPDDINPETGLPVPSNQLIQVTDLVGLKQTGWYNGKEYYGAVFYKDGVRYAGYYETAGVLIRVYSTKQESIDAQVTTPPSAILRQGTDVSSNDPRLNIPGTPQ